MGANQDHKKQASSPEAAAKRIISQFWIVCHKERWILPLLAEGKASKAQKGGYTEDKNILKSMITVEGLEPAKIIAHLEKQGIRQMDRDQVNAYIDGMGARALQESRRGKLQAHAAAGNAGCIHQQTSRASGALIGVYHAEQAGMDASQGAWATVCETHGSILSSSNRKDACSAARHPDWCSACQDIMFAKEQQRQLEASIS